MPWRSVILCFLLESSLHAQDGAFLEKYCIGCHGAKKQKGDLNLEALGTDVAGGGDLAEWRLVAEQVEFLDMPPEDEKQPDEAERAKFLEWISAGLLEAQMAGGGKSALPEFGNEVEHRLLFGVEPGPVIPGPPRLWRVRGGIYEGLMAGVGDGVKGLSQPLAGNGKSGIQDYSAGYVIDEATADMLYRNAEAVVDRQTEDGGGKFRTFGKLIEADADRSVAEDAVRREFGLALRRGPDAGEVERFVGFWEKTKASAGADAAAKSLLTAILMQPEVYYREETGAGEIDRLGRRRLSPDEIARGLSYALGNSWESAFFKAGADGRLDSKEGVSEVVLEVLESPKSDDSRLMEFFREYFGYEAAKEVFKDKPPVGYYNSNLLVSDLDSLVEWIVDGDKDVLRELLTTDRAFVNWSYSSRDSKGSKREKSPWSFDYCQSYGLPPDWEWTDQQPVKLPGPRRGVLMHPAWLAAYSGNFDTDPVRRGKWIRFQLLGGTVPDVPIGVDARIPEGADQTLRERLHSATSAPECWRCHRKMDPLGLPFEQFDNYSMMRAFEIGKHVDTSGAISRTGVKDLDGEVEDPFEMVERLADSEFVEQVFVRHVFRFFMGRNETVGDAGTMQAAQSAYRESGGSFRALVTSLLASDSFLYRTVETQKNPK